MVTTTMSPEQWAHIVQSLAELRAYKESEAKIRATSASLEIATSSSTSISALKRAKRKKKKQQQAAEAGEEVKVVSNSFSSPPAKRLQEILEAPKVSPVPPTSPTPATRVQRERDQHKALGPETDSTTPAPHVVKKSSPAPTPKPAPSLVAVPKERIAKKKPRTTVRLPVKTESFIDVDSWNLALPLWFLVGVVVRSCLLSSSSSSSVYSQPSPPSSQAWLVYSNGLSGAFVFNDSAAIVRVRLSLPTSREPLT